MQLRLLPQLIATAAASHESPRVAEAAHCRHDVTKGRVQGADHLSKSVQLLRMWARRVRCMHYLVAALALRVADVGAVAADDSGSDVLGCHRRRRVFGQMPAELLPTEPSHFGKC